MSFLWISRFGNLLSRVLLLVFCAVATPCVIAQDAKETSPSTIEAAKYQGPDLDALKAASKKLKGAVGRVGVVRSHEIWTEYRGYNEISRKRRAEFNAKLSDYLNQFVGKGLKPNELEARVEVWSLSLIHI